jgi:hypothetical protein
MRSGAILTLLLAFVAAVILPNAVGTHSLPGERLSQRANCRQWAAFLSARDLRIPEREVFVSRTLP